MTETGMIECPACGYRLRPGTLFCSKCGIYLLSDAPLPTEALPKEKLPTPPTETEPWPHIVEGYEDAAIPPAATALRISIVRSGRQVSFPLPIREITLGRYDSSSIASLNLDLTSDGALAEGVSRNHAKIYQRENRLLIEDVGSTNGTFVNKQRLTPHLPHALQEGDTVHLGRLKLLVSFS